MAVIVGASAQAQLLAGWQAPAKKGRGKTKATFRGLEGRPSSKAADFSTSPRRRVPEMNKKVAIFYTTGTKTTEATSWKLRDELAANGFEASDPRLIRTADPSDLSSCDLLVLGTPSYLWGTASVSALDFDTLTPPLADPVDLKGKPVAIFGTGDQVGYPQFFADGMGLVWNKMAARGAKLVGQWPTDSYTFEDSKALLDGKFIGMVIDDLNQPEQTDERIQTWVAQLKEEVG